MLGFVIGLGTELLTGQGILSQIGLWPGSSREKVITTWSNRENVGQFQD
jgi:hypothetical protein